MDKNIKNKKERALKRFLALSIAILIFILGASCSLSFDEGYLSGLSSSQSSSQSESSFVSSLPSSSDTQSSETQSSEAPSSSTQTTPVSSATSKPTSFETSSQNSQTTSKPSTQSSVGSGTATPVDLSKIPAYSGKAYVIVNNNVPNFAASEITATGYEKYLPLDNLGRTQVAIASVGIDTMPAKDEERGSISSITPSGWKQAQYDCISGGWLYNRCHLIGWQLSAENANKGNLITGTKYLNISGMLPFENMVADYIKETGNHVAYRITPIYEGNNLLPSGVQMEAYSVEDSGEGICFNIYCYNVQPEITIDYKDGSSAGPTTSTSSAPTSSTPAASTPASSTPSSTPSSSRAEKEEMVWISGSGKKYHSKSSCSNMKNPTQVTKAEAEAQNRTPCSKCY